jgi:hypothetical protein
MERTPFEELWHEALREHYRTMSRMQDHATLKTLNPVMLSIGFREAELNALYIEATAHVDDLPEGSIPALPPMLEAAPETLTQQIGNIHPAECQCPSCVALDRVPHDNDGQPLTGDALLEAEDRAAFEADDDDSPQQLSLF